MDEAWKMGAQKVLDKLWYIGYLTGELRHVREGGRVIGNEIRGCVGVRREILSFFLHKNTQQIVGKFASFLGNKHFFQP